MPKRKPPKVETREYNYPKPMSMTRTVTWWEKSDRERKETDDWNVAAKEYSETLEQFFEEKHEIGVLVTLESFSNLTEQLDKEKKKPRSYLAYEKLKVRYLRGEFLYYFGNFKSLDELTNQIEIDILEYVRITEQHSAKKRSAVTEE